MDSCTPKNTLVLFLPLLIIYILIGVFTIKPGFDFGDEGRYVGDVKNILSGKPLTLEQAPGYPLFLVIPRAIGLNWYWLKWFNPFLLFSVILFVTKSLSLLDFEKRHILAYGYGLGLYIPFWNEISYLYTEPLALAMISCSMYCCICFSQTHRKNYFISAALSLAFLALIKALIGYVVVVLCICGFVASIFFKGKNADDIRKFGMIFAISFILCVPYLIYTYSLTGKIFYWANTGGENVYWLTNPVKGEYGFWNSDKRVFEDDNLASHRAFISDLPIEDRVRRNEMFASAAVENIKKHPAKCFYNWLCNIGRMFFNYPYDYKYQNAATLFYTIPNSLVFWLNISLFVMLYKCRRNNWPAIIVVLMFFVWVYWLGQSCSTAGPRKMYLVIPVFTVCYAYILREFCTSKWRQHNRRNS